MENVEINEATRIQLWTFRIFLWVKKNGENILLISQGTDFWALKECLPKCLSFKHFYFNFNNLIDMTREVQFAKVSILNAYEDRGLLHGKR